MNQNVHNVLSENLNEFKYVIYYCSELYCISKIFKLYCIELYIDECCKNLWNLQLITWPTCSVTLEIQKNLENRKKLKNCCNTVAINVLAGGIGPSTGSRKGVGWGSGDDTEMRATRNRIICRLRVSGIRYPGHLIILFLSKHTLEPTEGII